jgi:hypothetical protein
LTCGFAPRLTKPATNKSLSLDPNPKILKTPSLSASSNTASNNREPMFVRAMLEAPMAREFNFT